LDVRGAMLDYASAREQVVLKVTLLLPLTLPWGGTQACVAESLFGPAPATKVAATAGNASVARTATQLIGAIGRRMIHLLMFARRGRWPVSGAEVSRRLPDRTLDRHGPDLPIVAKSLAPENATVQP